MKPLVNPYLERYRERSEAEVRPGISTPTDPRTWGLRYAQVRRETPPTPSFRAAPRAPAHPDAQTLAAPAGLLVAGPPHPLAAPQAEQGSKGLLIPSSPHPALSVGGLLTGCFDE